MIGSACACRSARGPYACAQADPAKLLLFLSPLVHSLFQILAVLDIENSRKVRETLREPLIMIAFPSDPLTPPLMGALVRTKEIRQLGPVFESNFMALRGIEKRSRPQIDQPRPALAMAVAHGNAGDGEALVRIRAKIG